MENENVVVDTDAAPAGQEDAQADEKSLDELLQKYGDDFDKGTKPPETEVKADPPPVDSGIESRLQVLERKETNTDIDNAADVFIEALGEMPVRVTRGLARAHLSDLASRDKRFTAAFLNRHTNPQAFKQVVRAASKNFKEEMAPIDQQTTNDMESVVTSIKGKHSTEVETPNFNDMTESEFLAWKMKNG